MRQLKPVSALIIMLVMSVAFKAWVFAGDLEPSADPAPTMHSMEDIYTLVENINNIVDSTETPVAKTGQTTSYHTGDDGDLEEGIAWPAPRFTDNNDGTVTDNLTGLIWLKKANYNDTSGSTGMATWSDAISFCNALEEGSCGLTDGSGAGDWRLPNRNELISLIDCQKYNPALPTGHPFTNVQLYYWSSTTYRNLTARAWVVKLLDGYVNYLDKTFVYSVLPVRSGN